MWSKRNKSSFRRGSLDLRISHQNITFGLRTPASLFYVAIHNPHPHYPSPPCTGVREKALASRRPRLLASPFPPCIPLPAWSCCCCPHPTLSLPPLPPSLPIPTAPQKLYNHGLGRRGTGDRPEQTLHRAAQPTQDPTGRGTERGKGGREGGREASSEISPIIYHPTQRGHTRAFQDFACRLCSFPLPVFVLSFEAPL